MKIFIKKSLRKITKYLVKSILKPSSVINYLKLYFISNMSRYKTSTTHILKNNLTFIDSASFVSMYEEIFDKEIYNFKTTTDKPYIIDGGSNIGLSIIYFKKLYPFSDIIAFEPDKEVARVLEKNIKSFELNNVNVINKGLWNKEENLSFFSEGADGGRISDENTSSKNTTISTLSLRPFLNKKVDFLKLDIEGAELEVLEDCADLLVNIDYLFVEYHSFINKKQTLNKVLDILTNSGFRYYIESIGVSSKKPFVLRNLNLNMDLQLNIYAYRN
jgi:FkbM family methyltransferase